MLQGASAAFIHAVSPSLCTTPGSRIVGRLYNRMILNRSRLRSAQSEHPPDKAFLAEHI
jgi:hypothetical protein